jgi:hypothetical protein
MKDALQECGYQDIVVSDLKPNPLTTIIKK